MKIVSVSICNLNSLKGKQQIIDFTKPPFSEFGLFAITGETGAGKTTILDAIVLALYGKVPRNCDPKDLMTHHTSSCWAEVEFAVQQKVYRAKWHLNRARKNPTGKLQSVKRELADISKNAEGKIIATKSREVDHHIKEITGLDYSRFLRSVMLAQGQFAAFLKASKNERGELLERITGTTEYSTYSKMAYEKAKQEITELNQLKVSINGETLLTDTEKQGYEQDLKQHATQIEKLQKHQEKLSHQIRSHERIQTLEQQNQQCQKRRNEIVEKQQAFESKLKKLTHHQSVSPFISDYQNLIANKERYTSKNTENQNIQEHILQLKTQLEIQKQELHAKIEAEKASFLEQQNAVPLIHEIISIDQNIKIQETQIRDLTNKRDIQAKEIEGNREVYEDLKKRLKQQQTTFENLQKWLSENSVDKNLDQKLPLAENLLVQAKKSKQDWERLKAKVLTLEKKKQEWNGNQTRLTQAQNEIVDQRHKIEHQIRIDENNYANTSNHQLFTDIQRNTQNAEVEAQVLYKLLNYSLNHEKYNKQSKILLDSLKEKKIAQQKNNNEHLAYANALQEAQQALEDKHQIYLRGIQIQKYEQDRKTLAPDQPCPLCGSEHHPFVENYTLNIDQEKQAWQDQKKVVQRIETQLLDTQKKEQKYQSAIEHLEENLEGINADQETLQEQFDIEIKAINKTFLILEKSKIQSAYHDSKKIVNKLRDTLQELSRLSEKIDQSKTKKIEIINTQHQIGSALKEVNVKLQNVEKEIEDITKEANLKHIDCLNFKNKITELFHEFTVLENARSWDTAFEKLRTRQKEYTKRFTKIEGLKDAVISLENQAHSLAQKIEVWELDLDQKNTILQKDNIDFVQLRKIRLEKFAMKDPQTEQKRLTDIVEVNKKARKKIELIVQNLTTETEKAQTLYTHAEHEQRILAQTIHQTEQELLDNIRKVGLTNFQDFVQHILVPETAESWQQEWDNLTLEYTKIAQSIQDIQAHLQQEKNQSTITQTIEQIHADRTQHQEEINTNQQKIGQIKQILKQHAETKKYFESVTIAIEKKEKVVQKWVDLSDIIGSAQGDKFRIFAQGLTLVKLVSLANRHLEKLNPRYLIRQNKSEMLELEILDTYQADHIRSMNTLSGGESFLVSLALALGLSDLAARKSKISSLFIDEGFGTLDNRTLDLAVSTLDSLQTTGKMIGIISHVQTLKERISAQIQVQKESGGVSKIKIVG